MEHDLLFDAIRRNRPHNRVERAAAAARVSIMGRVAACWGQERRWQQVLGSGIRWATEEGTLDATPPVLPDNSGRDPVPLPGAARPQ